MNSQGFRKQLLLLAKGLHFHTVPFIKNRPHSVAGANFAYLLLNTPTPCPPPSAAPVNRPFPTSTGDGSYSGFKLGQVCDFPNDVGQETFLFLIFTAIHFRLGFPRTPLPF